MNRPQDPDDFIDSLAALPAQQRRKFLEESCAGQPQLLESVVSRLRETRAPTDPTATLDFLLGAAFREPVDPPPAQVLGQRLGNYRVVREIGRGGMGSVYEAVHESLQQRIALKVLPASFALDPKRVERFRREARATASLRHPNIVPVHDVGEENGNHYYAMELIDGPNLATVIEDQRRALSTRQDPSGIWEPERLTGAIAQFAALAEGLGAAHDGGLVHRDVKPSNILVDRLGRYVLSDFGLVRGHVAGNADRTITKSGEFLGTLPYMSPEQVVGDPTDVRSDVYSLGVTMYEFLTLTKPLTGDSEALIRAAILHREPASPRKLNRKLHRDLETIVLHALEKVPARRYSTARELAADLRRFLQHEPIYACPASAATKIGRRLWRHRERVTMWVLLLILVVTLISWWNGRRSRPAWKITDQRQFTLDSGLTATPTISPDGRWIAYASDRADDNLEIWIQPKEGGEAIRLTRHAADDSQPAISPDGRRVAFLSVREPRGIYIVNIDQPGTAVLLAANGRRPRFSPDGQRLAYWIGRPEAAVYHGEIHVLDLRTRRDQRYVIDFAQARYPTWSPNGRELLFTGRRDGEDENDWWIVSVEDQHVRQSGMAEHLGKHGVGTGTPAFWTEDFVAFAAKNSGGSWGVWSLPSAALSTGEFSEPQSWMQSTTQISDPCLVGNTLVFTSHTRNVDIYSLPLGGDLNQAQLERWTDHPADDFEPALSPDGESLAFISQRNRKRELYLQEGRSAALERIECQRPFLPVFSPDGKEFAVSVWYGEKGHRLSILDLAASTRSLRICTTAGMFTQGWSADGSLVAGHTAGQGLVRLSRVESCDTVDTLERAGWLLWQCRFSPDNRWLCINALEESRPRELHLFVIPYREGKAAAVSEWIAVTRGATWNDKPYWSPDGNSIWFLSDRDGFLCLYAQPLDPQTKLPRWGELTCLRHFHSARLGMTSVGFAKQELSVSRKRIAFCLVEDKGNIWMAKLERE